MDPLLIKTNVFEGPLDLLLFLIKKMEIDIADIPIADVVDQYMDYLHTMKKLELAVAGEYLLMAATLLSIKSSMLLPKHEEVLEEEDEEDPRQELIEMLLEYQTFKEVAVEFSNKEQQRQSYYTKAPDELTEFQQQIPLKEGQLTLFDLLVAFQQVSLKAEYRKPVEKTIQREAITLLEKLNWMKNKLKNTAHPIPFSELIVGNSKQELVVAFLALLELMKENQVRIQQEDMQDELLVSSRPLETHGGKNHDTRSEN